MGRHINTPVNRFWPILARKMFQGLIWIPMLKCQKEGRGGDYESFLSLFLPLFLFLSLSLSLFSHSLTHNKNINGVNSLFLFYTRNSLINGIDSS